MSNYKHVQVPARGERIQIDPQGAIQVPDEPILPFIEGDGTGPDIWKAASYVLDETVRKVYGGKRKIAWMEVYAGEKSLKVYGENQWLPGETIEAVKEFKVALKGPLTTPVGGGIRSINVALRQELDLYACVRPVRWFQGVPAPVKEPQKLDVVIFRENIEDVYSGIEFDAGTQDANDLIAFLKQKLPKKTVRENSALGIKPVSAFGSKRLVRRAIQYAIDKQLPSVTLVHKGNIMKFTEGGFMRWGYEAAKEFGDSIITEAEVYEKHGGKAPAGKVLIQDRIADAMFQQLLLRPDEYSVIATLNLNGDYLSDACAAQVGGLGLAPGANIGDHAAVFEATHGTAPKYAGLDKINPGSVLLSGVMMLQHLRWDEAADAILKSLSQTISRGTVTYDLARQMAGSTEVKCSEFGRLIAEAI